jgi:hypothetical protein
MDLSSDCFPFALSCSYLQGAVISFLHLRQYVLEMYGQCLRIDDRATIQGVGDGGYGAIWLADALRRFSVQPNKVFVGAAAANLAKVLADTVAEIDANGGSITSPGLFDTLMLLLYTYSADILGVNNTETGVRLVSETYRSILLSGLANPNPLSRDEFLASLPTNDVSTLIDATLLQYLRDANSNNDMNPCDVSLEVSPAGTPTASPVDSGGFGNIGDDSGTSSAAVDALCNAFKSANPLQLFVSQLNLNYPVEICYGLDDTDIQSTSSHFPAFFFDTDDGGLGNFITRYEGPIGGLDSLVPGGNHAVVRELCKIAAFLFFNLEGHVADDPTLYPNYRRPFSQQEQQLCSSGSFAPTQAPVESSGTSGTSFPTNANLEAEGAPTDYNPDPNIGGPTGVSDNGEDSNNGSGNDTTDTNESSGTAVNGTDDTGSTSGGSDSSGNDTVDNGTSSGETVQDDSTGTGGDAGSAENGASSNGETSGTPHMFATCASAKLGVVYSSIMLWIITQF